MYARWKGYCFQHPAPRIWLKLWTHKIIFLTSLNFSFLRGQFECYQRMEIIGGLSFYRPSSWPSFAQNAFYERKVHILSFQIGRANRCFWIGNYIKGTNGLIRLGSLRHPSGNNASVFAAYNLYTCHLCHCYLNSLFSFVRCRHVR